LGVWPEGRFQQEYSVQQNKRRSVLSVLQIFADLKMGEGAIIFGEPSTSLTDSVELRLKISAYHLDHITILLSNDIFISKF
jgi:hypothetical protein